MATQLQNYEQRRIRRYMNRERRKACREVAWLRFVAYVLAFAFGGWCAYWVSMIIILVL